ncbi:MAG: hypothetical protein ABF649_08830 [Bacillus sp. (in: firmicutes)]
MKIIKKMCGLYYEDDEGRQTQILVLEHSIKEVGIQIPKGTVEKNETLYSRSGRGNRVKEYKSRKLTGT